MRKEASSRTLSIKGRLVAYRDAPQPYAVPGCAAQQSCMGDISRSENYSVILCLCSIDDRRRTNPTLSFSYQQQNKAFANPGDTSLAFSSTT
jgi:hypothetical protein